MSEHLDDISATTNIEETNSIDGTVSEQGEKLMLRTNNLVKKYGKRTVVSHVSINVKQGEIVGLLGPNGAGKTTTFYMTVGCMFGRYSLDKEGLILANQGETLEDYIAKVGVAEEELQFVPDEDNIIPILDDEWFKDDMVGLFNAFLKRSFGKENFEQNLAFVEESLGRDMRNYFLRDFYTDHVCRYKKRPIYWLFSSPKGSFNVLIYMHRYTPDTLNRIFNNYLAEYREKLKMHSEQLNHIIEKGEGREQTQAAKELDKIKAIMLELQEYERDILYPLATDRIPIDLDDGVLVNYNKFGEAIKQVAGLNDKVTKKKVKGFDWIDASLIK